METQYLNWWSSIVLSGDHVILRPLELEDEAALIIAANDGALWELWYTSIPEPVGMKAYIEKAIAAGVKGKELPFAVIDKHTNKVLGTTRFLHADPINRRLEIGYTWYAKSFQKTAVNTECKLLLLQYAFEELGCIAVEFRTHWHNQASRNAITRLGAKQDGVLRNHQKDANGVIRDTVVFSILDSEWAAVKQGLLHKMQRNQK